ncbi:MAG TPA: GC-type dockerin domain-anchored protein [Phycisphaerales bacterium]|nr:GC-type dockerin domain-anchored protein [Phycisphaerales bacterium]
MFKRMMYAAIGAAAMMAASQAQATFHLIQIEQVVGGVDGDTSKQAIQLRMRAAGQNLTSNGRLRVWDAAGANPVLIVDMTTNVANGAAGSRVLVTSAGFPTSPGVTPDYPMTNLIPASYLAAGSLTWESDGGIVYWRLSWGGAGYTGSNAGNIANDSNGDFGPPFGGPLPSTTEQAVKFQGTATALSTTNLADYALTAAAAVLTNNAGISGTVVGTPPPACPADISPKGGDGQVNIDDLTVVILGWGTNNAAADINDDGTVNIDDLTAVILGWGACP